MARTFLTLQTEIAEEARTSTSDDLTNLIKALINEYYLDLCNEDNEYPELIVPNAALVLTNGGQSVALPADYRKMISVQFSEDTAWRDLRKLNSFPNTRLTDGYPIWFFIAGVNLHFFPYSSILSSHAMRITYRKRVAELTADGDVLAVPDLWSTIKRAVLARIARFHTDHSRKDVAQTAAADAALNRTDR